MDTEPDAPTGLAPTELGNAIGETEANTAWSLDDDPDDDAPTSPLTPGRITGLAVAGSTIAFIAVVAAAAWVVLRDHRTPAPASPAAAASPAAPALYLPTDPEQHGAIAPPAVPAALNPVPAQPSPPQPIALGPTPYGDVWVRTRSGKTICAVKPAGVQCNTRFANPGYIAGLPISGVWFSADGTHEWTTGDPGDTPTVSLDYGTYRAVGWTIDASSEGTTFTNDSTGHSVFISVERVTFG